MPNIQETLDERGKRYGNYLEQTIISRNIRRELARGIVDRTLESDQEDALTMIAVKLSRIVNGDPDYEDNWRDIAGYATLVADRLNNKKDDDGRKTSSNSGSNEGNDARGCTGR